MRLAQALRLALVLGATAVALGGCTSDKNPGTPLIPAVNAPISDVPLPAGFTIDMSKSISHVVPGNSFRSVNHEYKGSDAAIPVVRFYKDQMPPKGWTLIDQNEVKGKYTLRFSKNKEDCAVSVWEGTFDTHINVTIGPSGTGGAAKN
jgi:hypothetical protein